MNNNSKTKQVIIMRQDISMSAGKMAAQASHASLSAVLEKNISLNKDIVIEVSEGEREWFEKRFTKVVLGIKSEDELKKLHEEAKKSGLNVSRLIVDAGFTEFETPTLTCIAIGPNNREDIDLLCGKLQLYKKNKKEKRRYSFIKKEYEKALKENNIDRINYLKSLMD